MDSARNSKSTGGEGMESRFLMCTSQYVSLLIEDDYQIAFSAGEIAWTLQKDVNGATMGQKFG